MTRTQYITIAELNEILGVNTYSDNNLVQVYEASELIEYHINDQLNDYTTSSAPTKLKLATAYQVQYMEGGLDEDYSGQSFTIGKYSASNNVSNAGEFNKISPKTRRLLIDGGLTRRII